MKKFYVSPACNACGECFLRTNQLVEDPVGYAVVSPDCCISESDLPAAEDIAAACPMKALHIVDCGTSSFDPDALVSALEQRLKAVTIPDISRSAIPYTPEKYTISHGSVRGEGRAEHSSASRAKEAGREGFRQTFWNHRKDFALRFLVQYKSTVLREFYDFSDLSKTHYAQYSRQFEHILREAKAEVLSLSGEQIRFPQSFTHFCPETDTQFQKLAEEKLGRIETVDYVNTFFDGFEQERLHRLRDYEDRIYSYEDVQIIGRDWLGNNKIKTSYSFKNANTCGKDLVKDINFYLCHTRSYGLLPIDEIAEDNLRVILREYRELVSGEVNKKLTAFAEALNTIS